MPAAVCQRPKLGVISASEGGDALEFAGTAKPMARAISTGVIVPVHYAGVPCAMNLIGCVAQRHGVQVVEDNAHGLFARYQSKLTGTFGTLAAQSFHETKNITCGEGGALIVNEPDLIERAQIIREKGTNRSQFFRGVVNKYSWVDLGSSYLPSDLLAAFLFAQLQGRLQIQSKRK